MKDDTRDPRDVIRMMQSLEAHPGWEIIRDSLQKFRDDCVRRMVSFQTPDNETAYLRGYICLADYLIDSPTTFIQQAEGMIDQIERQSTADPMPIRKPTPRNL